MRLLVVYNRTAGHGKAGRALSEIEAAGNALNLELDIHLTEGRGHATGIVENSRLELDGQVIERDSTFLEISNSRYTADFLMAPSARIDDGLLDVTLLGRISRRRLLRLFPSVFRGEHIHHAEVETFRASHVTIATEHPKTLSPDGELTGSTPADVICMNRALEVFAQPAPIA